MEELQGNKKRKRTAIEGLAVPFKKIVQEYGEKYL